MADEEPSRRDTNKEGGGEALKFIKKLGYKLNVAHTDPDQHPQAGLNNDLMLIKIGRMVMEFLQGAERRVISYSNEDGELDPHECT